MCVILNYITLCYLLTRTVLAEKKISQSKCNAQGSNNCSPSGIRASGSIFSSHTYSMILLQPSCKTITLNFKTEKVWKG